MDIDEIPQRLVIIGSGFIGLEFASMFADFGSAVTVLQHSAEFLPREDADIATAIREQLEAQGVKFLFHAETKEIAPASAGGVRLSVAVKAQQKPHQRRTPRPIPRPHHCRKHTKQTN